MPRHGTGSTTDRGLGSDHQRLRKELLPRAIGKPCPYCGRPMLAGQALDLDHWPPRMMGDQLPFEAQVRRMAHAYCNRRAGQRLAVLVRKRKRMLRRSRW